MPVIGIDLGTTNSLAAYFHDEDGEAKIIPNSYGESLTPSVVSVGEEGQIFVGKIAKERLLTYPERTASVFKRSIGSKKEFKLGERIFLAEELSALVLKKLKEDAEAFFGEPVTEAFISVPAYFNDSQRRATKTAGELAGLTVSRIVSEPTAAAVSYGLHEKNDNTKFLIFDLGGGTFDVSILERFSDVMEVRAVAGDNFLGGENFNEVLINWFIAENGLDLSALGPKSRAAVYKAAEIAKRAFSERKNVTMSCQLDGETYEYSLNLETFEKNCAMLLNKLKRPVIRALNDALIKLPDIDAVVLVGGGTKLPIIRNFVSKLFARLPASSINPDEVVALGVASCAALKERNQAVKEIILTDVCPFTLGTSIAVARSGGIFSHGRFFPIIERNSIIPVSKVERLYTLYDNQTEIRVDILQGENRLAEQNIFLGELKIQVPPNPGGKEAVDVRYTYDINGILEVEVKSVSTGKQEKMIIEKNPGMMSQDEIQIRFKELDGLKIHPRDKDEYAYLLSKGERLYQETIGDARKFIGRKLNKFEEILDSQNDKLIREAAKELSEFFDTLEDAEEF
jgi:molecular chaperone HscC